MLQNCTENRILLRENARAQSKAGKPGNSLRSPSAGSSARPGREADAGVKGEHFYAPLEYLTHPPGTQP